MTAVMRTVNGSFQARSYQDVCKPGSVEEWHGGIERRRGWWAKMRERAVVEMVKQGQSQKGTTSGPRPQRGPGLGFGLLYGGILVQMVQRMQRSLPQRGHNAL